MAIELANAIINPFRNRNKTITDTTPGTQKMLSGAFTPILGPKPAPDMRTPNLGVSAVGRLPGSPARGGLGDAERSFDGALYAPDVPTAANPSPNWPVPMDQKVTSERVQQYLLARFNPIRGLTPSLLANYLEQFDLGFLRQASLVWNKIRERDDQIQSVAVKRELKPTDMPWEIVTTDESEQAQQHKKILEDFYNNCQVTNCLDNNTQGGVQLLVKQMMRAVGDKYSVHEIVWKPQPGMLTAEFRYVPVWFFEARTGQLRFLPYELALQGIELEPAGWVVHTGDGLFQASAIAYLYKQLALKTWVNYNEKFGMPFLHGSTNAQQGSTEWNDFKQALMGFSSDGAILTSTGSVLEAINTSQGTTIPMEALLERMDRAIGRVWNGGDLHSMSRGGGAGLGSNPQMQSQDDLAKADGERIAETLNFYVDRWVIKYRTGSDEPLAKFVLQPTEDQNVDQDLKIDEFLIGILPSGTLGVQDILERYQRSRADDGEEVLDNPGEKVLQQIEDNQQASGSASPKMNPITMKPQGMANISPAGRRQYNVTSTRIVADELATVLAPLRARIEAVAKISDADVRKIGLQKIVEDLPKYLKEHAKNPEVIQSISDTLGTALVAGAADAAKHTNGHSLNGHTRLTRV
jgi:phage gp29-like protein